MGDDRLTIEDVARMGREWQERLLLSHWAVSFRMERLRDMGGERMGRSTWASKSFQADISLLDPIDHDPAEHWPYDPEQVVVHELLHLHFSPFFPADEDAPGHAEQERVIDQLARVLVATRRAADPEIELE